MNAMEPLDSVCWTPTPPRAQRAWLGALWRLWQRAARPSTRSLDEELIELDPHLLADIGAPDALLAGAHARREAQRQESDALRLGVSSGAWRHW